MGGLTDPHKSDLRLLEVRGQVEPVDRHHRHQARPNGDVLPDAHRPVADAAADRAAHRRRVDVDLRPGKLRASRCGLCLSSEDLRVRDADLMARGRNLRAGCSELRPGGGSLGA